MRRLALLLGLSLVLSGGSACGEGDFDENSENGVSELPYARSVISFEPGEGAGFGSAAMPGVVLGPPDGRGVMSASLEVLSLGDGGEIVLGFGDREIVNEEGPDFVVFENPFWPQGDADQVYAELGEVAVSEDGEEWHVFPCEFEPEDLPPYPGCAGWTPTLNYEAEEVVPLQLEVTGGDGFDLADVGIDRARYVRIRDVWGLGEAPSRGFDLDSVGLIHFQ